MATTQHSVRSISAAPTAKRSAIRTFATGVDLPAADRTKVNEVLNQHLADAFDLMSQVKQAHWNVKGSDFWQLHKLFDELAEQAEDWIDELAERVVALGGYATGTARMAAAASTLPEFPTEITSGMDYVKAVAVAAGSLHELGPQRDRPDRQAGRRQHRRSLHRDQPRCRQVPLLPGGAPPGLGAPGWAQRPSARRISRRILLVRLGRPSPCVRAASASSTASMPALGPSSLALGAPPLPRTQRSWAWSCDP